MSRWDIMALVVILTLLFAGVAYFAHQGWGYKYPPPNSFGSDWRCIDNPYANVCIKDVQPRKDQRPPQFGGFY